MIKIKTWLVRSPLFATIVAAGVTISSNVAYAQANVTDQKGLGQVFCNIINWMIYILLAVSIIMILFAAFQYVTGGDDQEKISKARKTITWAAVGLVVALLAKGFPLIVADLVPNASADAFSCS